MADAPTTPPAKHTGGKFRKGVSGNPGGKKRAAMAPQQPQAPQPAPQVEAKPQPHAEVEQSANATGKRDTRFKPGDPGKPKGTRHAATKLFAYQFFEARLLVYIDIDMPRPCLCQITHLLAKVGIEIARVWD